MTKLAPGRLGCQATTWRRPLRRSPRFVAILSLEPLTRVVPEHPNYLIPNAQPASLDEILLCVIVSFSLGLEESFK
jgi:hypothetical protein